MKKSLILLLFGCLPFAGFSQSNNKPIETVKTKPAKSIEVKAGTTAKSNPKETKAPTTKKPVTKTGNSTTVTKGGKGGGSVHIHYTFRCPRAGCEREREYDDFYNFKDEENLRKIVDLAHWKCNSMADTMKCPKHGVKFEGSLTYDKTYNKTYYK